MNRALRHSSVGWNLAQTKSRVADNTIVSVHIASFIKPLDSSLRWNDSQV
jgi:hypothetical protein